MILQIVCCTKTMYFKAAAVWELLNSIGNQFNDDNVKNALKCFGKQCNLLALAMTKLAISNSQV